ncbi:MAG TPA: TonB-dependent receptor [Terriglobales bacterium]|nr:TonB-dependent receptor [Terriglobales bacterium]
MKKFFRNIVIIILVFFTEFSLRSFAEAPSDSDALLNMSLADLGNVEVTSTSKEPEELWKTPAAVYVLTQDDIRRSGATTIPEALRLVPGVQVSRIDQDHWAVGIRGFADQFSKSMLVLVDGRSLYTPLFAGVAWGLQDGVLLEDVDRIEVIRGPGGTIWGANAVNGVINIITKSAKDTHGSFASVGGGNIDQGTGQFRLGSGNGSNFDYRVYGKAVSQGGEYHSNNIPYDESRFGQIGFRTDWSPTDRDEVTIQGDTYKGGLGGTVQFGSFDPPAQITSDEATAVSGGNLMLHWHRQLREGSDLQVQAYYDRTYALASNYQEARNTFDIDFIHHLPLPWRQDFIWGLGTRLSPSTFTQVVPTLNVLPHSQADNVYSGFVQDEIALIPQKFSITLGSKLEHNNFTGFEIQPSVRGLWTIDKHQTFWASVARAVRTPSRIEEDFEITDFLIPAPLVYLTIDGNKQLSAERLLGYEAGYRRLINSKLYLDISIFHNNYNNLMSLGAETLTADADPAPAHLTIHFPWANGIEGNADGVEFAPDWQPVKWWQLRASYAYLNLDLKNMPGNVDTSSVSSDEGSSPHNQISFESRFNLPKGFEFDQTYRYVSALPADLVKAYSTADAHLSWRATKQIELSIVGENLLQPQHDEFTSSPAPLVGIKRSVYAQITWRRDER